MRPTLFKTSQCFCLLTFYYISQQGVSIDLLMLLQLQGYCCWVFWVSFLKGVGRQNIKSRPMGIQFSIQFQKFCSSFLLIQKLLSTQFASIRIFCYSYVNVLICMLCYSFSINIPSVLHAKADREYNLQLSLSLSVIPSLLCSGQICSWGSTLQEPMILQKVIFSFHPFFLGEGYGLQKMIVQYYKGHTLLPGLCYQSNSQTWEKNNIG